jgi:hypothetical protein
MTHDREFKKGVLEVFSSPYPDVTLEVLQAIKRLMLTISDEDSRTEMMKGLTSMTCGIKVEFLEVCTQLMTGNGSNADIKNMIREMCKPFPFDACAAVAASTQEITEIADKAAILESYSIVFDIPYHKSLLKFSEEHQNREQHRLNGQKVVHFLKGVVKLITAPFYSQLTLEEKKEDLGRLMTALFRALTNSQCSHDVITTGHLEGKLLSRCCIGKESD